MGAAEVEVGDFFLYGINEFLVAAKVVVFGLVAEFAFEIGDVVLEDLNDGGDEVVIEARFLVADLGGAMRHANACAGAFFGVVIE